MRAYRCLVRCQSGCVMSVLVLCDGKDQIPSLVDAMVFPEDACGLESDEEVEIPAAYILADQS